MERKIISKLEEVKENDPYQGLKFHRLTRHWYVCELCRYLQREIIEGKYDKKYDVLVQMPIDQIRCELFYKGLSIFK